MTVEILTGPERRRRWSAEEKAGIVAQATAPEARVAEVARRHAISRSLLYKWCRERSGGALVGLVPVVVATPEGPSAAPATDAHRLARDPVARATDASVEIALAGDVRITLRGRVDATDLGTVLAALRAPLVRRGIGEGG